MRGNNWKRAVVVATSLAVVLLAVACIPPTTRGAVLSPGSVANGNIHPRGHVRYALVIQYPQVVEIYVDGHGPLDPTVSLLNAAGGRMAFNDDGGAGLDSRIVATLAPGTYYVVVAGYSNSMGPYTLTIR